MDIFDYHAQKAAESTRPLAERMRPRHIGEFVGQDSVVSAGSLIRHAVEEDRIFSMIFWGPPGCGKTTLARIIAGETQSYFVHFSAVLSGVKEIRAVIEKPEIRRKFTANARFCLSTKSIDLTKRSRMPFCITSKAG